MLEVLLIAAEVASDIETYGKVGGGAAFVIYMTVHGVPFLMKKWSEYRIKVVDAERLLDDSRTENQKTVLTTVQGLHASAMEITVAQRQLIERSIEATNRAENHADNLERIATTKADQDGRRH